MREYGMYWVRDGSEWVIAEFTRHGWFMFGCECEESDDYFDEIGEMVVRQ